MQLLNFLILWKTALKLKFSKFQAKCTNFWQNKNQLYQKYKKTQFWPNAVFLNQTKTFLMSWGNETHHWAKMVSIGRKQYLYHVIIKQY